MLDNPTMLAPEPLPTGEALATFAHELRDPLNSVLLALEVVSDDADPAARPALAIAARQARRAVRFVDDLFDLCAGSRDRLPLRKELHGGGGAAPLALSVGRLQLLFPRYLEQSLYAQILHQLGVAHYLAGQVPAQAVPQALEQLMNDPRVREQALATARRLQDRGPWGPLPRILESCLALLDRS